MTDTLNAPALPEPIEYACVGGVSMPIFSADQMRSFFALAARSTTPSPAAPDGWKLVPIEPTPKMIGAAFSVCSAPLSTPAARIIAAHKAMLAAAPVSPNTTGGV